MDLVWRPNALPAPLKLKPEGEGQAEWGRGTEMDGAIAAPRECEEG